MPTLNRIIRHPTDLAALSVLPLMQPRPRGNIRIESDAINADRRVAWERQLNRAYHACGCGEASLGTVIGLIAGGIWVVVRASAGLGFGLRGGMILLGCAVVGTAFGKVAGLWRAQARLQNLVRDIKGEWRAPPRPAADSNCG
jgi:hypothetical protein